MYVADQKSVKMPMMCETVLAGVGLGVHTRPLLISWERAPVMMAAIITGDERDTNATAAAATH
jgi:hypothetical protein